MKTKLVIWCIILFFDVLSIYAESINGVVMCRQGNYPVPGSNINIFNKDSLVCTISTNNKGKFEVSLAKGIYRIQVKQKGYYTLEDSLVVDESNESCELKFFLDKEPIMLDEVVVKANPIYIKNLDDGIIYNLSRDKYAQKDNLLNALNRIPLLMVNSDGSINVAGKSSYVVYLNGKPYNMANADPVQVLRSIPSSNVKKVEVITRPDRRFGENMPVINIITEGKSLDGYHININGMGATTPKAVGTTSVLGMANKIQFFAGYTYDLWGQRNQQWFHEYNYGNGKRTFTSSDINHTNKHTHKGRVLFQWDIDTLRYVYADFHINGIERNEIIYYDQGDMTHDAASTYTSKSDTWNASLETNIIYSSRFKNSNAKKWRIGYRFTLNPDNRNYWIENLSMNLSSFSKTQGRLYTHNLQLFRRFNITHKLFSYLTLNANIRRGTSLSTYDKETIKENTNDFHYTQILSSVNWDMTWYITKSNNLWFNIGNKLEYANDKTIYMDSYRQSFSYMPSAKLTWQPNWDNEFSIAFNSNIDRPSLQMLNPFIGGKIDNDVSQGSPELNDSKSYTLSLGYSFYGKKVSIHPTISGGMTKNAIMGVFHTDQTNSQLIETYSNISKVKMLSLQLFLSYRPWQWLTLRNVSSFGIQKIIDSNKLLNQSDFYYRSTSVLSLNLPANWQFESSFSCYKVTPKAWIVYEPGNMYSFSLSKTLWNGNMLVSVFTDSPFTKHGTLDSRTILSTPNLSYNKLWKIQTRGVGVKVSITLRRGKKSGLKRDTSLKDTDIQSGITN